MRCTKWLYASSAGIAANSPAAVLMSASLMPGATDVIDVVAVAPIVAKASMIPHTVPTHPVCRNDVQSCTAVKLTRSRGVAESRRKAGPSASPRLRVKNVHALRRDRHRSHQALRGEVEPHVVRRHRVHQPSAGASCRAE